LATVDQEWPLQRHWPDIAWVLFAMLNLAGMIIFASWETVPFHFIWVSLTILYGFRVWSNGRTAAALAFVIVATCVVLTIDIVRGQQPPDELTEVPLMAAMFLAMVWHARRRLAVIDELEKVSEANLQLLDRERRFVQDASHELRTPITVALGQVELISRTTGDPQLREDAGIAVEELIRLRRLSDRLLLLASFEEAPATTFPTEIDGLATDVIRRWSATSRNWSRGPLARGTVRVDPERVGLALDALVDNAVKHTRPGDRIELSTWRSGGIAGIRVVDEGSGIDPEQLEGIFDRFARSDSGRARGSGGVGLGLAIVRAVAEAHGGSVRATSRLGRGSTFELILPLAGGGTPLPGSASLPGAAPADHEDHRSSRDPARSAEPVQPGS
jgi:signal transduction histidine kinase